MRLCGIQLKIALQEHDVIFYDDELPLLRHIAGADIEQNKQGRISFAFSFHLNAGAVPE
jgi:hypothetical protein